MARAWIAALRRHAVVAAWVGGLAVAVGITARTEFVADLSAFLPSRPTAEQSLLLDQLSHGSAGRLLLIGIEGAGAEARAAASKQFAAQLRASGRFDAVLNGDAEAWQSAGAALFAHRYLLSPAVDAERFTSDGLREAIGDSVALLGTPAGTLIKPILWRDPTGESLRLLEASRSPTSPRSEHGVWVSREAPRAVLLATTRADGADLDAQQHTLDAVRTLFAPYAARDLRLLLSGPGTFGVNSRATIKAEVERLALAGAFAIVTLLWLALGSLRALGTALLPVASGVLAGIAAVSLGFGQVHGVTLGFGTTLIGEAVDYAIYYLIQARPAAHARAGPAGPPGSGAARWLEFNWPTVRLGLWTSVCGFGALLFSGFGGLAQLATFSIAGLVGAALTTRFVLPRLAPDGAQGAGPGRALRRVGAALVAQSSSRTARRAAIATGLAALLTLALLPSPWRGSLASLSPIDAADLRRDAELRADLGHSEAGVVVIASAPSEDAVLELAEAAGDRLDRLVSSGALSGYDSAARILPSARRQLERRAALPDAATLRARLAQATAAGPLAADRLEPFVQDVQAARAQPALDRRTLQGTPLAAALDATLLPASGTRPWRALLNLHGAAQGVDVPAVRRALADLPATHVLAIGSELDAMYRRYLREAAWQAAFGALAVLALLALHLRDLRRLLRLAEPIAAAALIVVATLAAAGVALGVLHLVGLLLVVAIGSNYALFFDHLRQQGQIDDATLASLLLANLTTVVAFGLLALSSIPALHAIGQMVAPGALLCLLLSAAFIGAAHD
jgi:predicted exporter